MFEWTTSFRYDKLHTRDWYINWFQEVARKYGLALAENDRNLRAVTTEECIESACRELWTSDEIKELERRGIIPLRADRRERLCRPIWVSRYTFQDATGKSTLKIEAADSNEFPCLWAGIWVDEELILPAGFWEVVMGDQKELDEIVNELRAGSKSFPKT